MIKYPRVDEDGFPYDDSEPLDYLEFFDWILKRADEAEFWLTLSDDTPVRFCLAKEKEK